MRCLSRWKLLRTGEGTTTGRPLTARFSWLSWGGNLHIRRRQRVFPDSTDARAEGRLGRPGPSVTKHTVFSSSEAQTPHCHPGLVTARPPRRSEARPLTLAGADFFVCPDNTAHMALEQPGK